ncbi:MAG: OsmC family protein [Acidobacteria bacterium]|nr:OsmC family protein [Acidobacteriota bacterium]
MVGTFGGALEARKINASDGRLTANVRGEVESDDGVLVIRRIHVDMKLHAPEKTRETVERVHRVFAEKCPVFRSLSPAIKITSTYTLIPELPEG